MSRIFLLVSISAMFALALVLLVPLRATYAQQQGCVQVEMIYQEAWNTLHLIDGDGNRLVDATSGSGLTNQDVGSSIVLPGMPSRIGIEVDGTGETKYRYKNFILYPDDIGFEDEGDDDFDDAVITVTPIDCPPGVVPYTPTPTPHEATATHTPTSTATRTPTPAQNNPPPTATRTPTPAQNNPPPTATRTPTPAQNNPPPTATRTPTLTQNNPPSTATRTPTPVVLSQDAQSMPSRLTLSATSPHVEGSSVLVTARLDGSAPAGGTRVMLSFGGSAAYGIDFILSTTTTTIEEDKLQGAIVVDIIDDGISEGTETIVLEARSVNPTLSANRLSLSITDNDAPPTATHTPVPTSTVTHTPTATATLIPTSTVTHTPTLVPTAAQRSSADERSSRRSTATRTPIPTSTFAPTTTSTATATPTAIPTFTPTPTVTQIPTEAPVVLAQTLSDTSTPAVTHTTEPTATPMLPTSTATRAPTSIPAPTHTPIPTPEMRAEPPTPAAAQVVVAVVPPVSGSDSTAVATAPSGTAAETEATATAESILQVGGYITHEDDLNAGFLWWLLALIAAAAAVGGYGYYRWRRSQSDA